jgi:hypothetical protein
MLSTSMLFSIKDKEPKETIVKYGREFKTSSLDEVLVSGFFSSGEVLERLIYEAEHPAGSYDFIY